MKTRFRRVSVVKRCGFVNLLSVVVLAIATMATPVAAAPLYQVEVVVFQQLKSTPSNFMGGEIARSSVAVAPIAALPLDKMLLRDAMKKLDASSIYRTVSYIGWRQNAARIEAVQVGDSSDGVETGVSGVAGLQVGQQLAVYADVTCRRDNALALVRGRRNVRLGELHYFDNPLCGVLMQVTKVRESAE